MDEKTAGGAQGDGPNLFRPDDVISPSRPSAAASTPNVPEAVPPTQPGAPDEVQPKAAEPQRETLPESPTPQVPAATEPTVVSRTAPQPAYDAPYPETTISWTASEYIAHQKAFGWYLLLCLFAAALAALAWFITRDVIATVTVVVGLLLLGVYASRKPREQSYQLDERGILIGDRAYGYGEFRSFAIVSEGAFLSIELMPLKRFAMYVTIYFDPKDADRIVDLLSQYLPMDEPQANFADSLMRRIHF